MVDNVSPWSQTSPIQNSPAMEKPEQIPYYWLPGSPTPTTQEMTDLDITSDPVGQSVQTLFPTYDSDTYPAATIAQPPDGFGTDPTDLDPDDFLSWHSMWQIKYLADNGSGSPKSVTIGGNLGGATATAILLAGGTKVGVIEQMQKTDFAKLSLTDQEAIAALDAFKQDGGVATRLGLIPRVGATVEVNGQNVAVETVAAARDALVDMAELAKGAMNPVANTLLTQDVVDIFKDEVDNLIGRLNNSGIFSDTEFKKQLQAIVGRWQRVEAFGTVPAPSQYIDTYEDSWWDGGDSHSSNSGLYFGVTSLDGGAAITSGFKTFVEQEKRMLALDNSKLATVQTGSLENKKLDVPNLVFLLQLNYNLMAEAKVTADTEEINQQNALLQVYGQMQQLVNDVSKSFGTDQEQTRNINGSDDVQYAESLPASRKMLISMFEDYLATNGAGSSGTRVMHPIEKLRGITRPLQDMMEQKHTDNGRLDKINEFRKTQWDSFNTQLSDTVTLINQENQIKMNDINSMNKQKDRHFDLANSALSKMFDTIQNIARATGN